MSFLASLRKPISHDGYLDVDSWVGQVQLLVSTDNAYSQRLVLYTMTPHRLFDTAMVSPKLRAVVFAFLEYLREYEPDYEVSDSGSEDSTFSDAGDETPMVVDSAATIAGENNHFGFLPLALTLRADIPVGFGELPPEVSLNVVALLTIAQRLLLSKASIAASEVVASSLQHKAAQILVRFRLKFSEVRLMQTATGTAISGSAVTSMVHPTFDPGDLDFIAPKGQGCRVVAFLQSVEAWLVVSDPVQYSQSSHIGPLWTLMLDGVLKINVIESTTPNPLDCVTNFHMTCVYGAWFANVVWLGYAGLTESGIAVTTPTKFPLGGTVNRHKRVWEVLQKYLARGFAISLGELERDHTCGIDFDCPATVRATNDGGCTLLSFPSWHVSANVPPLEPTTWTMGGTGCSMGIRSQNGRTITSSSAVTDFRWYARFRAFMSKYLAP
ncbi:hypothetical protein C8R47DRAFT_1216597 [Mycena vitilis]|nr:hypothetical protein C8R47DRAFT_1216597 [Mycena vitilis]